MLKVVLQNLHTEAREVIPVVDMIQFGYNAGEPGYWLDGAFIMSKDWRIMLVSRACLTSVVEDVTI